MVSSNEDVDLIAAFGPRFEVLQNELFAKIVPVGEDSDCRARKAVAWRQIAALVARPLEGAF